jgi:hypothetical protein
MQCTVSNCSYQAKGNNDKEKQNALKMHKQGSNCPLAPGGVKGKGKAKAGPGPQQPQNTQRQNQGMVQSQRESQVAGPLQQRVKPSVVNGPNNQTVSGSGFLPPGAPGNIPVKRDPIDVDVATPVKYNQIDCKKAVGTPVKPDGTKAVDGTHKGSYGRVRLSGCVIKVTPLIHEGAEWKAAWVLMNTAQAEEAPVNGDEIFALARDRNTRLIFDSSKDRNARTVIIDIPQGWSLWGTYQSTQTATTSGLTGVKSFKIEYECWLTGSAFPTLIG